MTVVRWLAGWVIAGAAFAAGLAIMRPFTERTSDRTEDAAALAKDTLAKAERIRRRDNPQGSGR